MSQLQYPTLFCVLCGRAKPPLSRHTENDINNFDFFIRMMPGDDKNIISVLSVPKFSIDGRVVKHLHFCVQSEYSLESQNILMLISQLIQLEDIVKDINLSTKDAEKMLKKLMVDIIDKYGKE